jgi:hypothetical protein
MLSVAVVAGTSAICRISVRGIAALRALRGDLTRATLDALRDALGPMTTKELARHVMAERGLNTADISLLQLFTGGPARCCGTKRSAASYARSKILSTVGSICGRSRSRHPMVRRAHSFGGRE